MIEGNETVNLNVFRKVAVLYTTPQACPDVILGLAASIDEAFACALAFGKTVHHTEDQHAATGLCRKGDVDAAPKHIANPVFCRWTVFEGAHREQTDGCDVKLHRIEERRLLRSEGRVKAWRTNLDRRHEVVELRALVALRPKHLHQALKRLLAIKAAGTATWRHYRNRTNKFSG